MPTSRHQNSFLNKYAFESLGFERSALFKNLKWVELSIGWQQDLVQSGIMVGIGALATGCATMPPPSPEALIPVPWVINSVTCGVFEAATNDEKSVLSGQPVSITLDLKVVTSACLSAGIGSGGSCRGGGASGGGAEERLRPAVVGGRRRSAGRRRSGDSRRLELETRHLARRCKHACLCRAFLLCKLLPAVDYRL